MFYKKMLLLTLMIFNCVSVAFPQRYNFQQFDIDKGLTQSQVTAFTQDQHRRLWIATLGGVSCFNGSQFSNYTRTNGLKSNFTLALAADNHNNIFIGSARGITRYDGQHFFNQENNNQWTSSLTTDRSGNLYALRSRHLYKISRQNEQRIFISGDTSEMVSTIYSDHTGKVWTAVFKKGIYTLEHGKWVLQPSQDKQLETLIIRDILVDKLSMGKIWLLTPQGIFILYKGLVKKAYQEITAKCMSITQDHKGAVWIGTSKGAYYISPSQFIHFNGSNGLTDNPVNAIFKDIENNIWLGTDGSGIFKFRNKNYVTFDETQGLKNKIVMSLVNGPSPGTIWFGSGTGLSEYKKGQRIKDIRMPGKNEESNHINFLYRDSKKNIWIGTPGGGLWMHNGKEIIRVDKKQVQRAYNAIVEDREGNIWLSTDNGCMIYHPSDHRFEEVTRHFGGGLLEMGKDSIISGTQDGALLITNKKKVTKLNIKALSGSSILSMLRHKEFILFGTADYGLVIWNSKTGSTRILNSKSGLASDHIYSLLRDRNGIIWVGTGRGINRLNSGNFSVIAGTDDNLLVECNQNAMLEYENHIWIGTTKGAVVYDINPLPETRVKPYIYINSVNIFPNYKRENNTDVLKTSFREHELKHMPELPYNHNHVNINYTGIFLTNPEKITYQYRLVGLDSKFIPGGSNTSINFTALPPGKYSFEVMAVTNQGLPSYNKASFTFKILPPYYQTGLFRFLMLVLIIFSILLTVYIILSLNERKRKLRLKIKLEEQFKIRKQTAEDFHDDLGNKLTRISVLSDVLSSMIDKHDTEKRGIIKKINDNVNELYIGTKDILWSLNPKNDTLSQLVGHIISFGEDMFNETSVKFSHHINLNNRDSRLSLDMSRNILLIFKESIHNILKHAKATEVVFRVDLNNEILMLSIVDNGQGFDVEHAKNGHGLNNLYVRAERINADFSITSDTKGTGISLIINFPTLKHFKNV